MLGYTRQQMGDALNVSPATIKNAENGHQRLAQDKIDRAEMLAVAPETPVTPALPACTSTAEDVARQVISVMLDAKASGAVDAICKATGADKRDIWLAAVKGKLTQMHC